MRKLMTASLLVPAVTLGACGVHKPAQRAATTGGPAVPSIKACELMTQPEAEAAVGQTLPNVAENAVLGTCSRAAKDFSAGADLTVGEWASIKTSATSGTVPVPVSGVGDEALNLNGSNGSLLYVRKGSKGFLLVLNGFRIDHSPDHGLALEKELASKVLSRL